MVPIMLNAISQELLHPPVHHHTVPHHTPPQHTVPPFQLQVPQPTLLPFKLCQMNHMALMLTLQTLTIFHQLKIHSVNIFHQLWDAVSFVNKNAASELPSVNKSILTLPHLHTNAQHTMVIKKWSSSILLHSTGIQLFSYFSSLLFEKWLFFFVILKRDFFSINKKN